VLGRRRLGQECSASCTEERRAGQLQTRVEGITRRMGEELRLAANVQRSLLPPPLKHPRLELAREFIPFREIGGDYFDFVPLGPERFALAIGDVMGKGVPAALLSANLKATLRSQLQDDSVPADEVVARVNHLYWQVTPKGAASSSSRSSTGGGAPQSQASPLRGAPGRRAHGPGGRGHRAGPDGAHPLRSPRSGAATRGPAGLLQRRRHRPEQPGGRDVRCRAPQGGGGPQPGRRPSHRALHQKSKLVRRSLRKTT
jgi:hypothetical protein